MLVVKMLMFERLLNFRFRGTTMSHEGLLIALENDIIDEVPTVPTNRHNNIDTSAPREVCEG